MSGRKSSETALMKTTVVVGITLVALLATACTDREAEARKAKAEAAKVDALDDLIKRCDQWNGHHRTVTFADVAALARIVRDMRATR